MLEAHSWKNPDACQPSPGPCSQMSKPRLREERQLAFRFNEEYFGCKLMELFRISLSTKQVFIRIWSRQEQLQKNSRGGELQEQLDPVLRRDCPPLASTCSVSPGAGLLCPTSQGLPPCGGERKGRTTDSSRLPLAHLRTPRGIRAQYIKSQGRTPTGPALVMCLSPGQSLW